MKKRINFYYVIILVLLTTLVLVVNQYNKDTTELIKINEGLIEVLDSKEMSYEAIIEEYENAYSELEKKYGGLIKENSQLQEQMNGVEIPVYKFTPDEVYTLAQCVEAEAGHFDKHMNSQKFITQVILNRLQSGKFPDTLEGVIYQKVNGIPQFSVAWNGMMNRQVEPETVANVYSVLVHGTNLPKYVLYFYNDSVTGNWVNTLNTYDVVEGTVFAYKNKEDF